MMQVLFGISEAHSNAQIDTFDGLKLITTFTNPLEEYQAIRNNVGIFDYCANGKFMLNGDGFVDWLNRLVSRDIDFFDTEKIMVVLCLDEDAQTLAIVTLYRYENAILLETEPDKRALVKVWLEQHRAEGIEITDVSDSLGVLGFEGPKSFKIAQKLIDFEISSLPFQSFIETEYEGCSLTLARTGYTGEYGYKVIAATEHIPQLWNLFIQEAQALNGQPCGREALELVMLEVRQPIGRIEIGDLSIREACLEWLFDFNKSDYLAKEQVNALVAEAPKRRLIGFMCPKDSIVAIGDRVLLEDTVIGEVILVSYNPSLDQLLGLSLNLEPFTVAGISWEIETKAGKRVEARTLSSPYVVPCSWTIKML